MHGKIGQESCDEREIRENRNLQHSADVSGNQTACSHRTVFFLLLNSIHN